MKLLKQAAFSGAGVCAFTLAAMAAQGAMRTYYANDPVGRNVVSIESHAPLETMLTTTSAVTGSISGDPTNIVSGAKARFEVDLNTLDTGIALRNEHMNSAGWLNTAQYPKAVFTFDKIVTKKKSIPLQDGKTITQDVQGTLQLHGVTKVVTAKVEITAIPKSKDTAARLDGDLLHVRAKFPLKLDDFGINVPAMAKLKVANVQQVTADIFSSTESKPADSTIVAEKAAEATPVSSAEKPAEAKPVVVDYKKLKKVMIEDITVGTGEEAKAGDKVTVHYRGQLENGNIFDESYKRGEPFVFNLGAGQVIRGWDDGLVGMKAGGRRKITIPPQLGYGARGAGGVIKPNETLVFVCDLVGVA